MKKVVVILVLAVFVAAVGFADVVNVSSATAWQRVDMQTFIVYQGSQPLCEVKLLEPCLFPTSQIQFLNAVIMPMDNMLVDGQEVTIMEVTAL